MRNTTISVTLRRARSSGGRRTTIRSIVTNGIYWTVILLRKRSSKRSMRVFSARLTRIAPGRSLHRCPKASKRRMAFTITTSCRRRLDQRSWNSKFEPSFEYLTMSTTLKKEHKSARPERGGQVTLVEAIRQGIWEEMERDATVFVIGEDVGAYGGAFKVTDGLIDQFGKERVIDTPISEGAIVGAACGAALMGMRPVAEFQFIDFISAGFDLLTNYAAKCRYRWGAGIPAVFRGPCGSGVRSGPFHSLNAESFFLNTAGLKIVEPSTAYDAKGLIKAAIRDPDPVLYFEHKKLYRLPRLREELPSDDYIVEIGKARVARAGRDLSIITFGAMVLTALDAAEELEKEGLDVEVIDLRTLAPLDKTAIVTSVKKTSRALVLHE